LPVLRLIGFLLLLPPRYFVSVGREVVAYYKLRRELRKYF